MSEVRTPVENADRIYKEVRRKWRRMGFEGRQKYFFGRTYRGYTKTWRSQRRDHMLARIVASIQETRDHLAMLKVHATWFAQARPTEETFKVRHNIENVDSTGSKDLANGGKVSWRWRDQFNSDVRIFDRAYSCLASSIEDVETQLEYVDDSAEDTENPDPYYGLFDEIADILEPFGLELHEEYNERDDGCIWFRDVDTGQAHFYALINVHHGIWRSPQYNVMDGYMGTTDYGDRWKQVPLADLSRTILYKTGGKFPDHLRSMRAYSDAIASIRWYFKNLEKTVPRPDGLVIP